LTAGKAILGRRSAVAIDRCDAVHGYRASAAKNGLSRGEQALADGYAEEFLVRGEPEEVFRDRHACRSSRGLCNLMDSGPVGAVLGAQRVGLAAPLCADAACRQPA